MRRALLPLLLATLALGACDSEQPPAANAPAASAPAESVPEARQRWPFGAEEAVEPGQFDPASILRRNYYVVFDASGSMGESGCSGSETKLAVAKRAFTAFSAKLPTDANLGLLVFDNKGIRQLFSIRPLNRDMALRALEPIQAGGGTPLAISIRYAYQALTSQAQRQLGYGEYHLVVVTDGEASGENPVNAVNTLLEDSPVVLHTIGFCIGENHSLNQPGRVVYRSAGNASELAKGLADVLAEAPAFSVQSFK